MIPAPRWLLAAVLVALSLVAALLWAETQRWRPYYSAGDESAEARVLVNAQAGQPLQWAWAQGGLRRGTQLAWLRLAGAGPGRMADLSVLAFGLELVLLAAVAARWIGSSGAAWAVLADLCCADSWMRARSIMAFSWLPAELLLLAWLSGKVRSRTAAAAWGAAAAALTLDWEGFSLALPGLLAVCLTQEPGLRRRWAWASGSLASVLGCILLTQSRPWSDYLAVRHAVSLGGGGAFVLGRWGRNLWQLLAGGEPVSYFSVQHWPAFALWALPLAGLGAWLAWRSGRWAWLLWAALVLGLGEFDRASWGVPAHRLAAAWPLLCLLAGLGGAWLQERMPGPRAVGLLLLLLALGAGAEADAYFRHMAIFGSRNWGRSANFAAAAKLVGAAPAGVAVDSALLEARYPDLALHVQARRGAGGDAWVLLPPEYRLLAPAWGRVVVVRGGGNDEPVLLLHAQGAAAARFDVLEADLRPLLPLPADRDQDLPRERAWLARGGHDDWARWLLLSQDLRHSADLGVALDPQVWDSLRLHPPLTPAPWVELGRVLLPLDPAGALRAFDQALQIDPLYAPAFLNRVAALEKMGQPAAAEAQRQLNLQAQAQGAWAVAE
jgi:hypothetical protein